MKIKDFVFRQDGYLSKHKVGIEIDEYDPVDSDPKYEKERRKLIKDHGITIIRTNLDAADFNINRLIKLNTLLNY